jgi:DNA (cytosine-5)-methyltransferase 1
MKYLSVCSGIEAATVAWHPLGWQPVAFGEIEKFPCQVLAHHYPDTPNWGDMTKFKEWPDADVNVFVGGTPCQSFSVAGLRKGLDDPRGNLMLTYLAIAARYRPRWLVWENVPGVLSSNGGLDFASLLRGMGELGYGFAYRILDAQYFGVAQRRRRVFVVGYLGNWRPAAAVLFERHSLSGHPAPSREKREGVAPNAREGSSVGSLCARTGQSISVQDAEQGHLMPAIKTLVGLQDCNNFSSEITGTIVTREGCAADTAHMVMQPIAFSRNDDGRDATNDLAPTMRVAGNAGGMLAAAIATHDVAGTMLSRNTSGGFSNSIDHAAAGYMALQPIALAENTIGRKPENGGNGDGFTEEGPMYTLNATGVHGVAQPIAYALDSLASNSMKSANPVSGCNEVDISKALDTSRGLDPSCNQGGMAVQQAMAVRRLTPKECERLQGFPDNYTDIKPKGKATPDGPRYKALGNSMAVPVMAWIGKRIQEVDAICQTRKQ